MSCQCGSCISRGTICVPRGNSTVIIFSVRDSDGDLFDISGASEIVFTVSDGEWISGSIGPGGTPRITKRLTDGQIIISTNLYQFRVVINNADTIPLIAEHNYYEAEVTAANGRKYTVSNGLFKSPNTQIRGI